MSESGEEHLNTPRCVEELTHFCQCRAREKRQEKSYSRAGFSLPSEADRGTTYRKHLILDWISAVTAWHMQAKRLHSLCLSPGIPQNRRAPCLGTGLEAAFTCTTPAPLRSWFCVCLFFQELRMSNSTVPVCSQSYNRAGKRELPI